MREPLSGHGNGAALRRILTIFPFGDGGHRRSSGGSFDTRATKAALIVAGNREKSAATCALLCGGIGRREAAAAQTCYANAGASR